MQTAYLGIIKKAVQMGIKIAMGTDAGTNYNYHGKYAAEIIFLAENDILSPMKALQASTKTAAEAIMKEDLVGTLEKGKQADFVLLNSDPIARIRTLSDPGSIAAVYKKGSPVCLE